MGFAILLIIVGLVLLVWSADRFVHGAQQLAQWLGIPPLIIGLTIVALGTSAPEIVVAIIASMKGHGALVIGSVIGSNIANVGLVLGGTALFIPLQVQLGVLRREYPILLFCTLLVITLMVDGMLSRVDGFILLLVLLVLILLLVIFMAKKQLKYTKVETDVPRGDLNKYAITWLIVGAIILPVSADMLINGATRLASYLGVSDFLIGVSVVAIGTSLPELAASLMGAIKGHYDIAVGNVIGSNIINLVLVLALPGLISPTAIDSKMIIQQLPILLLSTIAIFLVTYGFKGKQIVSRFEGAILLIAYVLYLIMLYYYA